jgi:hypothetical protein
MTPPAALAELLGREMEDGSAISQSGNALRGASSGSEPSALPRPRFGDIIENGWASEGNPTRTGLFVREGVRTGRLNRGRYWQVTDGKGKFWELAPTGEHRITVTPVTTSLDKAWRAVDALGGTHATDKREWGEGYDEALTLACAEIEKLGGRPS